jgi:hypothetical protein
MLAAVLGAGLLISACGGGNGDDSSPPPDKNGAESFQSGGEGSDLPTILLIMTSEKPEPLHIKIDLDPGESIAQSDFHSLDSLPAVGPGQTFGFDSGPQSLELKCAPTGNDACGVRAFLHIVYGEQLTGTLKVFRDSRVPTVQAVFKGKTTTLQPGKFTLP